MSYHLGTTVTQEDLKRGVTLVQQGSALTTSATTTQPTAQSLAQQAQQAQALAAQAQALATAAKSPTATATTSKAAAIAAAQAEAQAEMLRKAQAALSINALLIKNAKVEMSQSGGKLSQARWDFHAAQMRGARFVDLVPPVQAALDAKIVSILGPRPGVSLVTLPGTVSRDPRMPVIAPPQAPVVATPGSGGPVIIPDVRPDSPPAVDAPPPRGVGGEGNTMLYVGGAAVVLGLLVLMRRR